jgi:hypothetical protein
MNAPTWQSFGLEESRIACPFLLKKASVCPWRSGDTRSGTFRTAEVSALGVSSPIAISMMLNSNPFPPRKLRRMSVRLSPELRPKTFMFG